MVQDGEIIYSCSTERQARGLAKGTVAEVFKTIDPVPADAAKMWATSKPYLLKDFKRDV